MEALAVALGAAIGAPARYLLDRFVQDRLTGVFPWGTFAVNLLGSFVLEARLNMPRASLLPRLFTS